MYQRFKTINLNKIQRSNERVSQEKESLERHNDSLQNKSSQIRCIPHGSFGLSQCQSSSKKSCWLTKSLERHRQILKKKMKGPPIGCIPHGS